MRIYGARDVKKNFTVTSWNLIILDVIPSSFLYNFQTSGMFFLFQRLYCLLSAELECLSNLFILNKPFCGVIFLMVQKVYQFDKK